MMHNTTGLYELLNKQLVEVNRQIDSIVERCARQIHKRR